MSGTERTSGTDSEVNDIPSGQGDSEYENPELPEATPDASSHYGKDWRRWQTNYFQNIDFAKLSLGEFVIH